jgi:hypothetical protein
MSEEDLRQLKAMALLDCVESKKEVLILWEQISEIGEFLKMMGEDLKTNPSMYAQKEYTWPSQKDVDNLVKTGRAGGKDEPIKAEGHELWLITMKTAPLKVHFEWWLPLHHKLSKRGPLTRRSPGHPRAPGNS